MNLITDALVEKAANIYVATENDSWTSMHAALTAIVPDIVEQCAKVADHFARAAASDECTGVAEMIAARTRSLAPKEDKPSQVTVLFQAVSRT